MSATIIIQCRQSGFPSARRSTTAHGHCFQLYGSALW
jgi:hypothetical protein